MRRTVAAAFAASLLFACTDRPEPTAPGGLSAPATAGSDAPTTDLAPAAVLWGPERYNRIAGKPQTVTTGVTLAAPVAEATLRVANGDADGTGRVSSASVTVNGREALKPSDLSQDVAEVLVPLTLGTADVTLEVTLAAGPEGHLTLSLERGQPTSPAGGELALDGGAVRMSVPAGAVTEPVVLTAEAVEAPEGSGVTKAYDFGPDGTVFVAPITVRIGVDAAALPPGVSAASLRLFWLDESGDWQPLENSGFDPATGHVHGDIDHFTVIAVAPTEVRVCPADPTAAPDVATGVGLVASRGRVLLCTATHPVTALSIAKPVTIEAEAGASPDVAVGALGFVVEALSRGTVTLRGLHVRGIEAGALGVVAQSTYDALVVEDVSFADVRYAVVASASTVPGARVTAQGIEVHGGDVGVFGSGAPRVDVYDSRFVLQEYSGVLLQVETNGTVAGNTVEECGRAGCIRISFAGDVVVTQNVVRSTARRDAFPSGVLYGIFARGRSVLVEDNLVEGLGVPGDPGDRSTYAFADGGIAGHSFREAGPVPAGPASVVASRNTIRNAGVGMASAGWPGEEPTVAVTGSDNRLVDVHTAFLSEAGGAMTLHRNDVAGYRTTIVHDVGSGPGLVPGSLTCTWWGDASGPAGVDPALPLGVYLPAAGEPIAGNPGVACDPTPLPAPTLLRVCADGSSVPGMPTLPTLEGALAQAADGATIRLCEGAHSVLDVTLSRPVTLEPEAGRPVLDPGEGGHTLTIRDTPAGTVAVRGLELLGGRSAVVQVGSGAATVQLEGNVLRPRPEGSRDVLGYTAGVTIEPGAAVPEVSVVANTFEGGDIGVSGDGFAGRLGVSGNAFNDQTNAALHVGNLDVEFTSNDVRCSSRNWCVLLMDPEPREMTARLENNRFDVDFAQRVVNVVQGDPAHAVVSGNAVTGTGGTALPDDPSTWPIETAFALGGTGDVGAHTVTGNHVTRAHRALSLWRQSATGRDNVFADVGTAIFAGYAEGDAPTSVALHYNDVSGYAKAFEGNALSPGSLACSWWGAPGGPTGLDPWQSADAAFPWTAAPVAGSGDGLGCDPAAPAPAVVRVCADGSGGAHPTLARLADALAVVADGGTVELCEGVHASPNLNVHEGVTIRAEAGTLPVLDAQGQWTALDINNNGGAAVTVAGLRFTGAIGNQLQVGGLVGDVLIEGNAFASAETPGGEGGNAGVHVSGQHGGAVTVRGNTFHGGDIGVGGGQNHGHVTVEDNDFVDQANGAILLGETLADVVGNRIAGCGSRWCVLLMRNTAGLASHYVVRGNTIDIDIARPVVNVLQLSGDGVEVTDNVITGTGGARSGDHDPATNPHLTWPIQSNAINVGSTPAATVSRNTVRGAYWGIGLNVEHGDVVAGTDNVIDQVHTGLLAFAPEGHVASVTFHRNDVTGWSIASHGNALSQDGTLTCNWWGDAAGPSEIWHPAEAYTPWATAEIAGTGLACP